MGEELERSEQRPERSLRHPGLRADVSAIARMLDPARGQVFMEWLDSWRVTDSSREGQTFAAAAEAAGMSADDLLDKVIADPAVTDLFRTAMELAIRSGTEQKLKALGKALAHGALASDDAEFDEAVLAMRTIGELEPMDVRVLLMLTEDPLPAWVSDNPEAAADLQEFAPPLAIRTHLQRLGLVRGVPRIDGISWDSGTPVVTPLEITEYGRAVLALLGEAGKT